jgi:hypothetical protein
MDTRIGIELSKVWAGFRGAMGFKSATGVMGVFVALGVFWAQTAVSQSAGGRKTVLEQLQEMRETNRKLLERQGETLKKLEELEKQASQLKFLTKRG